MPSVDVVKILGLGVMGLGFLLAFFAYRLLAKIQSQPNPSQAALRSTYFFMAFSIALCVIGFASQLFDQRLSLKQSEAKLRDLQTELEESRKESEAKLRELRVKLDDFIKSREQLSLVSGNISSPADGSVLRSTFDGGIVRSTFDCSGTAEGFAQGVHLWLAVELNGLMWPRDRHLRVSSDGQWSAKVFQDGKASKFSLVLIAADEVAHAKIVDWLQRGQRDGKYGELKTVEGIVRLDRKDIRLENKQ